MQEHELNWYDTGQCSSIAGRFEERHPLNMDTDCINGDRYAYGKDPPASRQARLRLSGNLNVGTERQR